MHNPTARRFTRDNPCPICGGWDELPRGQGRRCHGFLSRDGRYAHCSREELAGALPVERGNTYAHRLAGDCRCGVQHGPAEERPRARRASRPVQDPSAIYDYRDAGGALLYQVVRYGQGGGKTFKQRRPDGAGGWTWSVRGVQRVLYRLPELLAAPAGEPVFIVEGEKDADGLAAIGMVATTNSRGADGWDDGFAATLGGRDVIIVPDNDPPGEKHAATVAASLDGIAASVRVLRLPGLPEKGDVSDWLAAGGTAAELRRLAAAAPPWAPAPPLPNILTSDRELRDKAADALAALLAANAAAPELFERAGALVRVREDEDGRPHIEELTRDHMRGHLARVANWLAYDRRANGYRHVSPPADVAADLIVLGGWGVPPLLGLTELPPLRPDGTVCTEPGYDPATRLFYAPAPGFTLPAVPEAPGAGQVAAAVETLSDLIADFPFTGEASRAAALAALLTIVLRPAIAGNVPLFLFDKPKAGTGASLLADVIAIVATGRPAAMMGLPDGEEEFDKRITAALADGAPLFAFDNADLSLESASLARMITASTYRGRVLGQSKMVDYPQRAMVIVTGNNIKLRGDIGRRSIWCRMDARLSRPWERDGFRHPELLRWATEHRAAIVAAALTLARAWFAAGRPDGGVKPLGSFETWTRMVGGILAVAGVRGFLGNLGDLYELADEGATQWAAFLAVLADEFGERQFTCAEITRTIQQDGNRLLEALPDDLAGSVGKAQFQRVLGKALSKRIDTRFDGRRLARAGTRHSATLWMVATDGEDLAGGRGVREFGEFATPYARENAGHADHINAFLYRGGETNSPKLPNSPETPPDEPASGESPCDCGGEIHAGRCQDCNAFFPGLVTDGAIPARPLAPTATPPDEPPPDEPPCRHCGGVVHDGRCWGCGAAVPDEEPEP